MASARSRTQSPKQAPRSRTRRAEIPPSGPLEPKEAVAAFRQALRAGEPWYPALLGAVARWVAPEETVDGEHYRYLIAGEAFDWLRLAQRLLQTVERLVPRDQVERLLFFGVGPEGIDDDEFARVIGPQKHSAHLNFRYGVVVEEALLLCAEQELDKAGRLSGAGGAAADVAAYGRVYGKTFDELTPTFRAETGAVLGERATLAELQAFTYWCSRYRFRLGEPARVASDTRKALALLSTMESARATRAAHASEAAVPVDVRSKKPRRRARATSRAGRAARA